MASDLHIYYLSGPMSGRPNWNFPVFEAVKAELVSSGHTVVSAHEIPHADHGVPGSIPWETYLRDDLKVLLDCTAIIMLPGWVSSRGACLELYVALCLKLPVFYWMIDPTSEDLPGVRVLRRQTDTARLFELIVARKLDEVTDGE